MVNSPYAVQPLSSTARQHQTVSVPGSKSFTNRAFVCAALASGVSRVSGVLLADDTEAMIDSLRALGVAIELNGTTAEVTGVGGALPGGPIEVDVNQSGTTSRFLLPLLALGHGEYVLDGHEQMRARPFDDLIAALTDHGASIEGQTMPLKVHGRGLSGGVFTVPGDVSSQFLSALLLSAPYADDTVEFRVEGDLVSKPYVDMTLATMEAFGAIVERDGYASFCVAPTGYVAASYEIEPDASAASYFFGAAAVTGQSVTVRGLGRSALQGDMAFVQALAQMGAAVDQGETSTTVTGPAELRGIEVDMANYSDTAQTLAVVAAHASTETTITGIGFIRRKETDRIHAVVTELGRLGIDADEHDDGLGIRPGVVQAGLVQTYDDHRMAMSFAIAGLVTPGIEIADPGCVAKTFPDFFAVFEQLNRASDGLDE